MRSRKGNPSSGPSLPVGPPGSAKASTARRILEGKGVKAQARQATLNQKYQHTFSVGLPSYISSSVEWKLQGAPKLVLLLPASLHCKQCLGT